MDTKIYSLWLTSLTGIGTQTVKTLFEKFNNSWEIYELKSKEIDVLDGISSNAKLVLKSKNLDYAKSILEQCNEKKIDIMEYNTLDYPLCLSNIYAPPVVLYKLGKDIDYDKTPLLAVVGSRDSTYYGENVAEEYSSTLSQMGIIIVSGMARGIDASAHKGALKVGKPTVAVLGTGVDVVYPSRNKDIYDYIVQYGTVLSEYPPGSGVVPSRFPQRNRIISAISQALLVVEAGMKSGALITADMANEQGKDVFAIPNGINVSSSAGTNKIIKEYAHLTTVPNDIAEFYYGKFGDLKRNNNSGIKKDDFIINVKNLSDEELKVVSVLSDRPKHCESISRETLLPLGKVNALLVLLEIKGIVYSVPGNSFALNIK